MRCPQCANKVLQKSEGGDVKLRAKGALTFTSDGLLKAQCYWCNTDITIKATLAKSLEHPAERFVLVKAKELTPLE